MTLLLVQVKWVPSRDGGTSVAANEAWDSWPSIRQEGLEPPAKDPWAALRKVSCSHPSYAVFSVCFFVSSVAFSVPAASFVALSENASFHNTGMLHCTG